MFKLLFLFIIICLSYSIHGLTIKLKYNNFVSIRDTIDEDSVDYFLTKILDIESDIIYIYINSNGGSVDNGMRIINYITTMKENNKEIICIAERAMSMSFVIFQYCSKRYITPTSILMQHQMSLSTEGDLYNVNSRMRMMNKIEVELNKYQAMKLNMSEEKFIDLIHDDLWLFGSESIKINAADDIVNVICDFRNTYEYIRTSKYKMKILKCPLVIGPIEYEVNISDNILNLFDKNNTLSY